ncbi:hypothetical protein [Sutcliffiella sp. FSL R7-0096]|uniref:hypothetical protein n=1 Tax=Sutcliffiella sp. FSL R7-0096 TaxID=2921670 RepID=UPI00315ABDAD
MPETKIVHQSNTDRRIANLEAQVSTLFGIVSSLQEDVLKLEKEKATAATVALQIDGKELAKILTTEDID